MSLIGVLAALFGANLFPASASGAAPTGGPTCVDKVKAYPRFYKGDLSSDKALLENFDKLAYNYYYCRAFSSGIRTAAQLRKYLSQYETEAKPKHEDDQWYQYYLMVYFASIGQADKARAQCSTMNLISAPLKPDVDVGDFCGKNVDILTNHSAGGCQSLTGLIQPRIAEMWLKFCETSLTGDTRVCQGDRGCANRVMLTVSLLKKQPDTCPVDGKFGALCLEMLGRAGSCDAALDRLAKTACQLGPRVLSRTKRPDTFRKKKKTEE